MIQTILGTHMTEFYAYGKLGKWNNFLYNDSLHPVSGAPEMAVKKV